MTRGVGRGRVAGYQTWRDLLFLHWPVPAPAVRRLVPDPLDLDLHSGQAWVGVVAFEILDARPPAVPPGSGLDFLETNVRTYVRRGDGPPAVWFFSLDAASRLAVAAARLRYGLPYHTAAMRIERVGARVAYATGRRSDPGVRLAVRYRPGAILGPAPPGTLDHFLHERYVLHALRRGRLVTAEVRHAPYELRRVELLHLEEGLLAAAGLPPATGSPRARWAPRADVQIVS